MTTNFSQTAAFLWSVADLQRGDFKQGQYGGTGSERQQDDLAQ